MRGTDEPTRSLFSHVDLEERIPARHPLPTIRQVVNDALASLDTEFDQLYAADGRPSIAPERLIRASLLQILFSIRSRPTVFSKNRDRLLTTEMSRKVMAAILPTARSRRSCRTRTSRSTAP